MRWGVWRCEGKKSRFAARGLKQNYPMAIFRFGTKRNIGSGATGLKALAIWYTPQGLEPRTRARASSQSCGFAATFRRALVPGRRQKKTHQAMLGVFSFGADYGARTRHLRLGKATLYQMS